MGSMLIKSEYDIQFHLLQPTPMVAMLRLHPQLDAQVKGVAGDGGERLHVDQLKVEHIGPVGGAPGHSEQFSELAQDEYMDGFGNRCARFVAPAGAIRLSGSSVVEVDSQPELQGFGAMQAPVERLPHEVLQFLLPSRYCEVDKFGGIAQDLFGHLGSGWALAASIRDWVHEKVAFNYKMARATKTAMDVYSERVGVCRDYQHLSITLCRCMNLPARYVTGFIGDIRVPYSGPGDFSAWYQVWLDGKWWDMDARHNYARIGRLLMATGRDAADVAITTSFGRADLTHFYVESNEIDAEGRPVPLPPKMF
jgi:transglutaminase-like putative cysteine protease